MRMAQTIALDIRGQICPSCLLLTLKEVNQHAAAIRTGSAEIVVTTDDRQATATIPSTIDRMGFGTEVVRVDGVYRIRIFAAG
jgi:TusA-related sulfurtransferase